MYNLFISYINNNPVLQWSPYRDSTYYSVYRGRTKTALTKIGTTTLLQYRDEGINIFDKQDRDQYYYQIKSNDSTAFTDIVEVKQAIRYPVLGVLKEIVRRNNLMLREISGETVTFYIKKGAGERCTACYNELLKDTDTTKPLCPECYNTSYLGGFEKVTGLIRIKNNADSVKQTEWGIRIEASKQGWLSDYPIVQNGDWVRTPAGEIYQLDSVKHKRVKGFLTFQSAELILLETGHLFYNIE